MYHLRLDLLILRLGHKDSRPVEEIMEELGITYQVATPRPIGDMWQFWNCENVPEVIPDYLSVADWNPMNGIGYGLSKEEAESIRDYKKEFVYVVTEGNYSDYHIVGIFHKKEDAEKLLNADDERGVERFEIK